jgi:hypothetical protein
MAWRRWRVPLALIGVIVLGGIAIAAISRLSPPPQPNSYLDPASSAPDGAHALTDILGERGYSVIRAYSVSSAIAAAGSGSVGSGPVGSGPVGSGPVGSGPASRRTGAAGPATLVVTSPYLLTHRQLIRLAQTSADLLVVEPGRESLAALAPRVRLKDTLTGRFGRLLRPGCDFTAARLAGTVNLGGSTYLAPASAIRCYPSGGFPTLVRYRAAGRTVTILGSGAPLMDELLARNGNAALAMNLLSANTGSVNRRSVSQRSVNRPSANRRIVWLTPEPQPAQPALARPGEPGKPGPVLIPWPAWLVVIQLGIAVVLIGLWRARRLGPLIAERLPVVVRASETVEGHAALYQSRRARDRAAAALRGDLLARMLPALGLARDAPAEAVTEAVAARSRLSQHDVAGILYGTEPGTDAELVALARSLDELESEVCGH